MRHLTCAPNTKVLGAPLRSNLDNMATEEIEPFAAKYGLVNIQPDKWYPMQSYLDMLNDMGKSYNLTDRLVSIGLEIFQKIAMPPELENADLPTILNGWNDLYQMQHRGEDIGYVRVTKMSETHYKTEHKNLYPDDMLYGVAYGMAKRFLPHNTHFKVYYDPNANRVDQGGNQTVIHIEW